VKHTVKINELHKTTNWKKTTFIHLSGLHLQRRLVHLNLSASNLMLLSVRRNSYVNLLSRNKLSSKFIEEGKERNNT